MLVLAGAAVMAAALLVLPLVLLAQYLRHRRTCAAAARSACVACGTVLGRAALRAADAEWDGFVQEWRRRHPHAKPRLVRRVHAVCPHCRAKYRYAAAGRSFEAVPAETEPGIVTSWFDAPSPGSG